MRNIGLLCTFYVTLGVSTRSHVPIIAFCTFFLLSLQSFGQKTGQAKIDSMLLELPKLTNDTLKGRTYNRIVEEYFFIDTDKALKYSRLGLAHVTKMNWKRGIAVFNSAIGRAYSDKGNYDSCLFFYNRALALHKQNDDKWNMASTLNNLGTAAQNILSNSPKAAQYYFEALKLAEQIDDKYLAAICQDNISVMYSYQKNYPKALDYGFKSLRLREQLHYTPGSNADREVAQSLSSIAAIYTAMNNITKAKSYYQKAIPIHQKVGNKEGLAKAYGNMALIEKDYSKRLEYCQKAMKIWNEVNPNHLDALSNKGNLGMAYFEMVRDDSLNKIPNKKELLMRAESYLQEVISHYKKNGEKDYKSNYVGNLAELQALKGDYKNAYFNFRAYQQVQDSLYSQESKNKIAGLEGKREIELRDKKLELNNLELSVQKKQRLALLIGMGLLLVIGGLLYWQNQTRKRTNTTLLHLNSELDEANKVKAKFFAILSHDLRSPVANLISFLHLQKEAPELLTPQMAEAHHQKITEAAEGLLETMESMLLWSKGQMQQFKPQVKSIEVNELFAYLQKFFAGIDNVQFEFENADSLMVATDEDYLKTIMQNLTANAIKALKNTPHAVIHWSAKQENGQIVLSITDNGPGMSEQNLNALYSEVAAIGIKTGLGLHLIRDLAKAITCKIMVQSRPVGTEFRLIFATA